MYITIISINDDTIDNDVDDDDDVDDDCCCC